MVFKDKRKSNDRLIQSGRFEPCEWSDLSCHALVDIAAVSGTPLRGIVGHHKNAGTWLKGYDDTPPSPFASKLRLRLRRDTWVTLVSHANLHFRGFIFRSLKQDVRCQQSQGLSKYPC